MNVNRENVQHFVDQLAEKLGRSVAVDDRYRRFITSSRHFGDLDSLRVNVLVSRHLDDKSSDYIYSFVDAAKLKGPVRVPRNDELGIKVRRCYPVRHNDGWVGFLWLIGDATEVDDRAVENALPELALALSPKLSPTMREEASAWAALLGALSKPARRSELANLWKGGEVDPQTNVAILVAYAEQKPQGPDRPAEFLDALVNRSFRDRKIIRMPSVSCGPLSVALVRIPNERLQNINVFLGAHSFAGQEYDRISVGLSKWGPVAHATELLSQATLAAYAAFVKRKPYLSWPECNYQGVLLNAALRDPENVIPAPVSELAKTSSGIALMKTALVFLEEGGDITRASQRLNIHRTTLYYRLARVEEQTGYELKNGNDRLALQVGASLMAFLDTEVPHFLRSEEI